MLKNLVNFAILTSIVILSWIGFGIYHNYTTSTIENDQKILITPIPAKFDERVIDQIKQRKVVEADLNTGSQTSTSSSSTSVSTSQITPVPTAIPIISQAPSISETPTITPTPVVKTTQL